MNANQASQYLHAAWHTPWNQLFRRIGLALKRRTLARFSTRPTRPLPPWPIQATINPQDALPRPVFGPRHHLVRPGPEGLEAVLLNVRKPLCPPLEWLPRSNQLDLVTLHYMEYLESADDATFTSVVLDWIRANPPYMPGYWNHHWNSYALSLRCLVWMQQMAVRGEEVWNRPEILSSLYEQLEFLRHNLELDIRGNHLLKNIKTLLWGSRVFDGRTHWVRLAVSLLETELADQVEADGFHFEGSPGYHLQVFADLLECYSVLDDSPLKPRLRKKLDGMAQAVADMTHPDGLPSLLGDSGLHMAYSPNECLGVYEKLTGERPRPRGTFAFPDVGFFGMRTPQALLIVDCGRVGPDALPAHGHGDILSFELTVHGKRVITDTGVFEYQEGARRARSRGTKAHNTLTLDGADQADFWKSFRVGRRPDVWLESLESSEGQFSLQGAHTGFKNLAGHPVHHRKFVMNGSRLSIRDWVTGGSGQEMASRLLIHPDFTPRPIPGGFEVNLDGGFLRILSPHPAEVEPAPWWPDFGIELMATQLVFRLGSAPGEGSLVIELPTNPVRI